MMFFYGKVIMKIKNPVLRSFKIFRKKGIWWQGIAVSSPKRNDQWSTGMKNLENKSVTYGLKTIQMRHQPNQKMHFISILKK